MSLVLTIVYLLVLLLIATAVFAMLGSIRTKGSVARALNLTLLAVTLPRERTADDQRNEKELIAIMEQLYASLGNIHAKGWNKFVYGEPYIALEMAVHHVGEEIHFYVAVPRAFQQTFAQQLHGLYPTASVVAVKDYSIFNPSGVVAASYVKQTQDPVLPVKTYTQLQGDPIGPILTSMSKIAHEGEGVAVQILVRPSHREDIRKRSQDVAHEMQSGHDFKTALAHSKKKTKLPVKDQTNVQVPKVPTAFEQAVITALQSKASRPLYECNIRCMASADSLPRAEQILGEVSASLAQFASPDGNSLETVRVRDRSLQQLTFDYSFRMFNNAQQVYLSSEELTSLYHFPLPTTQSPKVKSLKSREAEPPANLPDAGVIIGTSMFRGQARDVRITDDDRRRHVYVIGQTGTGKSSLMKNMITQDLQAGKGLCVIDPHGELAQYVLSVVPPERADDVIYFNPGQADFPIGLNMLEFDTSKPEQKTFVTNELLAIVKSLYKDIPEAFGPMFEQYFKNAILLLLDAYEQRVKDNGGVTTGIAHTMPTLADIPRVMTDAAYRDQLLQQETNELVKNFWTQEAAKAGGDASLANMAPYISSKLTPFVTNDYLRPIVTQPQSAFSFRDVMDSKSILVVNLSKGVIGEINASLLGMVVVGKLLMAALSRVDVPEEQRQDFYLYIDEFQSVTTESIATILSEARKYRLDLIIAHQYIKQLREEIRNAVFGNVGSLIAFRIGAEDAEVLKPQFDPVFSPQDLINIDNFKAHVKVLIQNQTSRPFNMETVKERDGKPEIAAALAKLSQRKYARARSDVEDRIRQSYQQSSSARA